MHGGGDRRSCPNCGQSVTHQRDVLANLELRGPRNITSSNIDRVIDDGGNRFLFIEEKRPNEAMPKGQAQMLQALSHFHDVWIVKGTPAQLRVWKVVGNESVRVLDGDFAGLQRLVDAWFSGTRTNAPLPTRALEAPFSAPEGFTDDEWRRVDKYLTEAAVGRPI